MIRYLLKFTAFFFFSLIFLSGCKHADNKLNIDDTASKRNLILFAEYKGEEKWGYLDEDSGEVAITAKYVWADPFVGNFAVVQMNWDEKKYIIDKNEKTVCIKDFDKAYLITSENGEGGLAILENYYKRKELHIGGLGDRANHSNNTYFYDEDYKKYSMINLVNGKTIFPEKENWLTLSMYLIGDYFFVDSYGDDKNIYLYQFLENGDIKCVTKERDNIVRLLKTYLKERNITPDTIEPFADSIRIDFRQYLEERYANPDLSGAFSSLDSDFTFVFDEAEPLYRNPWFYLNTPLEIKERKYSMYFKNEKTKEVAEGIYNETKAEWELKPYIFIYNSNTNKNELYYIVDIFKTNNPNYYRIHLNNDNIKEHWRGLSKQTRVFDTFYIVNGGIYNIEKHKFMENLYLYKDIERETYPYFERLHRFPDNGIYYSDLSRIIY